MNKVYLMRRLFNLQMSEGGSVVGHINEFNMIVSKGVHSTRQPDNQNQHNPNYKGWLGWISISGRVGFIFLNLNWIGSVSDS